MEEYLAPIVSASREVSRRGNIHNPTELKRIVSSLNENYETGADVDAPEPASITGKDNNEDKPKEQTSINKNIGAVVKEASLILQGNEEIEITYIERDSSGSIDSPFDYIYQEAVDPEEENAELQVQLFKSHPLWNKKIDPEVQKILATSDAIYRVLVEKLHFDTSDALKIRNEWVKKRTN